MTMPTTRFLLGRRGRHLYPLRHTSTGASSNHSSSGGLGTSHHSNSSNSSGHHHKTTTTPHATVPSSLGRHSVPPPKRTRSWNFQRGCRRHHQPAYVYGFPIPSPMLKENSGGACSCSSSSSSKHHSSSSSNNNSCCSPLLKLTLFLLSGCLLGAYWMAQRIDQLSLQQSPPTPVAKIHGQSTGNNNKNSHIIASSLYDGVSTYQHKKVRTTPRTMPSANVINADSNTITEIKDIITAKREKLEQSLGSSISINNNNNGLVPLFLNVTLFQIPCDQLQVQVYQDERPVEDHDRLEFKSVVVDTAVTSWKQKQRRQTLSAGVVHSHNSPEDHVQYYHPKHGTKKPPIVGNNDNNVRRGLRLDPTAPATSETITTHEKRTDTMKHRQLAATENKSEDAPEGNDDDAVRMDQEDNKDGAPVQEEEEEEEPSEEQQAADSESEDQQPPENAEREEDNIEGAKRQSFLHLQASDTARKTTATTSRLRQIMQEIDQEGEDEGGHGFERDPEHDNQEDESEDADEAGEDGNHDESQANRHNPHNDKDPPREKFSLQERIPTFGHESKHGGATDNLHPHKVQVRQPTNGCQVMGHLQLPLTQDPERPVMVAIKASPSAKPNLSHRLDLLKLGMDDNSRSSSSNAFPMEESWIRDTFTPQTYTALDSEITILHRYTVRHDYHLEMAESPTGGSAGESPELHFKFTPSDHSYASSLA